MSVPLIIELMMKENPSVKKTLADIAANTKATLAAGPITLLPPNQAERLAIANQLLAQMRQESLLVTGQLVNVRDSLNEVAKVPGIGAQAQQYQEIQAELKAIGAASEDVRRVNPQLEASYKSLTASAEEGLKRVADRSRNLAELGQIVATAFAGTGTVFGGLAAGSLAVAANFESLKAKLVSVTGSIEDANSKFEFAREFAASTPFDVEGIVSATAIIESFKLKSEELLPVAANLAAAMGTDLAGATLALAKAASGSADGFQVLKDSYGISNKALGEFGGVVDKTTGQLSHLEKDVEKNRNALIKLINTRFGDAIQRQSDTLKGALSNVGDAANNLAASFGENLIPLATTGAKGLSAILGVAQSIPGPFKAVAAVTGVMVAGVGILGAAVIGSVTALLLLQAQLIGIAAESPLAAAGLNLVAGSLARMSGAAVTAQTGLLALAANPVVLGLLAIVSAAGVAGLAISAYEANQVKAGDAVAASSRQFAKANSDLRAGIKLLNDAGAATGKTVAIVGSSAAQVKAIQDAFAGLNPLQFASAMDRAGASVDGFKSSLAGTESQMKRQQALLTAYQAELERLKQSVGTGERDAITGIIDIDPAAAARIDIVTASIKSLQFALGQNEKAKAFFSGAIEKATELDAKLQPLIDSSRHLATILDLSKSVGSASALQAALGDVQAQINANAGAAEVGSANLDELLGKLRGLGTGSNTEVARQAILEQIKLVQQRDTFEKVIADKAKDREAQAVEALELNARRRKALGEAGLQEELAFINERLAAVRAGTEEEVSLLERKAATEKAIREKAAADGKAALDALFAAGEEAFKSVELAASEGEEAAKGKLEGLNATIASQVSQAVSTAQKLAAVNTGITSIQAARAKGLLLEVEADKQILALTTQRVQLEQQLTAEKAARAGAIAALEQQNLEQELAILQARKDAGEKVEDDLLAKKTEVLNGKLAIIEAERVAAVEAAKGSAEAIEQINRQAELKTTNILNAETLKRAGELAKQVKDQDASLTKQEQRASQSAKRSASPLLTFDQAFNGPGSFGFDAFSLDTQTKPLQAPVRTVTAFQQARDSVTGDITKKKPSLATAINEAERAKKAGGLDFTPGGRDVAKSAGGNTITQSIYVNGAKLEITKPALKLAVTEVLKEVAGDAKFRGA